MVEWETGEITEEPLSIIAQDDPVTCAAYAKEHNLLHLPEWNKLKHIAKHQKTLTRAINQTKIRQVRRLATHQFGYLIPRDYKHALELDKINGNSRCYDATKKELDQINDYQVFIDHGIGQSVAGGHVTPDPIDSIYSGVVSTRSLRLSIFLVKLNNMEVWGQTLVMHT